MRSVHLPPTSVLIVDDDQLDVMALERAFQRDGRIEQIEVARDGIEGLELLRVRDRARPVVVLLDLNMPRMSGLEMLAALRADESLAETVVFVLTTSSDERDIEAAYGHHVAGYIVKERAGRGYLGLVEMLSRYELLVELPSSKAM